MRFVLVEVTKLQQLEIVLSSYAVASTKPHPTFSFISSWSMHFVIQARSFSGIFVVILLRMATKP